MCRFDFVLFAGCCAASLLLEATILQCRRFGRRRVQRNVGVQLQALRGRIVVAGHVERVVVIVHRRPSRRIGAEFLHILGERLHTALVRDGLDVVLVGVRRLEKASLQVRGNTRDIRIRCAVDWMRVYFRKLHIPYYVLRVQWNPMF